MGATIEVRGLCKNFGPTLALDGMTFTVAPGQLTGFVGPNGPGKTTTMRVILGLDAPDAGTALVGGHRYATLNRPLTHLTTARASACHFSAPFPRGEWRAAAECCRDHDSTAS